MPVANSPPASKTKNDQRRWNPRVTDTADIREDLAKHRLELLRRKLSERGLRSRAQPQTEPDGRPGWISQAGFDQFVQEFSRNGFTARARRRPAYRVMK